MSTARADEHSTLGRALRRGAVAIDRGGEGGGGGARPGAACRRGGSRRHHLRPGGLALRRAALAPTPSAGWCGSPSPRSTSTRRWNASRAISPRIVEAPGRATRSGASSRSTSPGAAGVRAAARLAAGRDPSGAGAARHLRDPLRRRPRATGRSPPKPAARAAPGRPATPWVQPDPDRRPLPPGAPRRRRPRRLRGGAGPQAVPARARGSARALTADAAARRSWRRPRRPLRLSRVAAASRRGACTWACRAGTTRRRAPPHSRSRLR